MHAPQAAAPCKPPPLPTTAPPVHRPLRTQRFLLYALSV